MQVHELEALNWEERVLEKMPPLVPGVDDPVMTGLQLEEEVQIEQEIQQEMEVEIEAEIEEELNIDQCGHVPFYLPWKKREPKEYSASEWLYKDMDARIVFTENFLPVERRDHLFARTPFDRAMPRIRTLHVVMDRDKIEKVIIGDTLDDVRHRPYESYWQSEKMKYKPLTENRNSFTYDIRTRRVVAGEEDIGKSVLQDLSKIEAQVRWINGEFEVDKYPEEVRKALKAWFRETGRSQEEIDQFFLKKVLRTRPQEAAAYKTFSRL